MVRGCSAVNPYLAGQGAGPVGVVAARQQPYVYVANQLAGTLSVIDTRSNTEIAARPMPGLPTLLALTSDDATLYLTLQNASSVAVIETAKLLTAGADPIRNIVPVGGSPAGVAVSADDKTVYVVNSGEDSLSVISTHTRRGIDRAAALPRRARRRGAERRLCRYVSNCQLGSVSFISTILAVSMPQNRHSPHRGARRLPAGHRRLRSVSRPNAAHRWLSRRMPSLMVDDREKPIPQSGIADARP